MSRQTWPSEETYMTGRNQAKTASTAIKRTWASANATAGNPSIVSGFINCDAALGLRAAPGC